MESASPQPAKASRAWGSQLCHDIYWEQLAASASYPPTHQLKPGHDHLPPGLGVVEFLLRPCDLFLARMGADGIKKNLSDVFESATLRSRRLTQLSNPMGFRFPGWGVPAFRFHPGVLVGHSK